MPILQINFKLSVSIEEYRTICKSLAHAVADIPGLRWKVWLLNELEKEAGGIYLFNSEKALNDYLAGPIVAQVRSHPGLEDLSAKRFEVMQEVTVVTRGPIASIAAAQ